jgi:SAM-dependent methyltransferase
MMDTASRSDVASRTIADFGEQWTRFQTHEGFYASVDLLRDICGPLLAVEEIRGRRMAEIGSGTGRIVQMFLDAGAAHVVALEPSVAFDVLTRNLSDAGERVSFIRARGDELPPTGDLDLVASIGVLHHIPEPEPVVAAALRALRPGGKLIIWLYGHEGNGAYLALIQPLRWVTTRLPPGPTEVLARVLSALFTMYMAVSRVVPLPLRGYIQHVIGKFPPERRVQVIFDQMKPAYAKYYRRHEAIELVRSAGFEDVRIHHRHGYSWTVIGTKPPAPARSV